MINLTLVRARRFFFDKTLYEQGKVYKLPDAKAKELLEKEDKRNIPYFKVVLDKAKKPATAAPAQDEPVVEV